MSLISDALKKSSRSGGEQLPPAGHGGGRRGGFGWKVILLVAVLALAGVGALFFFGRDRGSVSNESVAVSRVSGRATPGDYSRERKSSSMASKNARGDASAVTEGIGGATNGSGRGGVDAEKEARVGVSRKASKPVEKRSARVARSEKSASGGHGKAGSAPAAAVVGEGEKAKSAPTETKAKRAVEAEPTKAENGKIEVTGRSEQQRVELERYNRGVQYMKSGALEAASREFRAVLQVNPMNVDAMINLSAIEIRKGRYDEARDLIERVLSFDPNHYKALLNLGILEFSAGDLLAAEEALRRAEKLGRRDVKLLVNLSLVEEKLGRVDAALVLAEEASRRWPRSPEGWYRVGALKLKKGDHFGAAEAFERFVERARRDDPRLGVVKRYLDSLKSGG